MWNFFIVFPEGGLKSNAPKSSSSFLHLSHMGLIAMYAYWDHGI